MKKILTALVVVICIGTFFLFTTNRAPDQTASRKVSKNTLVVTMFTKTGKRTGALSFQAPFLDGYGNSASTIKIEVDIDGSGTFSDSENFIKNTPLISNTELENIYFTSNNIVFTDGLFARVTVDKTEFTAYTQVLTKEVSAN